VSDKVTLEEAHTENENVLVAQDPSAEQITEEESTQFVSQEGQTSDQENVLASHADAALHGGEEGSETQSSEEDMSPFAVINGVALTKLPEDLYIPPDAMEVFLEAFEGPLDLLLYLIRKHNLDILNIPIAEITHQYIEYIELMKDLRLELAADYLVMAAMLAEIKSRMLLPRSEEASEEEDPRAELVRRLQEYERIKQAAERLEQMPRLDRDIITKSVFVAPIEQTLAPPDVDLSELLSAFLDILKRSELIATHKVHKELLSVRERMSHVLDLVNTRRFVEFHECFDLTEGRLGVVVSFIAVLELLKLGLIDIVQTELFGPIHITQCNSAIEDQDNPRNEQFASANRPSDAETEELPDAQYEEQMRHISEFEDDYA